MSIFKESQFNSLIFTLFGLVVSAQT